MIKKWGFALIFGLVVSTQAWAQQAYTEGVDYRAISPIVKTSHPDKVVVTEVFWYGCPHCFRFEPYILSWEKNIPEGVVFEQVPSVLNRSWANHARAFYTFKLMGIEQELHEKLFNTIHIKRKRLNSLDQLAAFVDDQGFDGQKFRDSFTSFAIDSRMRKSAATERRYGHNGVPAVIVNGKYLVSASMAGSNARLIRVLNYLVAKEQAAG